MELPTQRSSSHHATVEADIKTTLTTPTFIVVNTSMVSTRASTNQLDFIMED